MKKALALGLTLLISNAVFGDALYKYKDSNGTWVYSDRKPKSDNYTTLDDIRIRDTKQPAAEPAPLPETRNMQNVRSTLSGVKKDVDDLYAGLLQQDTSTAGSIQISFTIEQNGTVSECTEDETNLTGAKFDGAICQKFSELSFGQVQNPEPTLINYGFNFSSTSN